jgi:hypothetical protein
MEKITPMRYQISPPLWVLARLLPTRFILGFVIYRKMVIITLQQVIDERVSFLKEQINPENKPQFNRMFQIQIEAIRSVDDYTKDKVESIIKQKKAQLKNSQDVHESERLFSELDGLEWLQRQIARYS